MVPYAAKLYFERGSRSASAADVRVTGKDGLSNTVDANGFTDATGNYSQQKARAAFFWYPQP